MIDAIVLCSGAMILRCNARDPVRMGRGDTIVVAGHSINWPEWKALSRAEELVRFYDPHRNGSA